MQLWLVALAAVLMWRSDTAARNSDARDISAAWAGLLEIAAVLLWFAGWGLLIVSVAVTIAAGGTVG